MLKARLFTRTLNIINPSGIFIAVELNPNCALILYSLYHLDFTSMLWYLLFVDKPYIQLKPSVGAVQMKFISHNFILCRLFILCHLISNHETQLKFLVTIFFP